MHFTQGNLLDAPVEAVVNTVNTVGVMGKGIALMFKEKFPEHFAAYAEACKANEVQIGKMFITPGVELEGPRWIINFPTKKHWRQPSQLMWVEEGLVALKEVIKDKQIQSIAIPPLGCGQGGLDWTVVRSLIERILGDLPSVKVIVFEPTLEGIRRGISNWPAGEAHAKRKEHLFDDRLLGHALERLKAWNFANP